MANNIVIKCAVVGHSSGRMLVQKYVENTCEEDGCYWRWPFMEKTVQLKQHHLTFSLWPVDISKRWHSTAYDAALPNAVCCVFVFDLTDPNSLTSIKQTYKEVRARNKTAIPLLVGTNFHSFQAFDFKTKETITTNARRYAKAMKSPLIFVSCEKSINVRAVFKLCVAYCFRVRCKIKQITGVGDPILQFSSSFGCAPLPSLRQLCVDFFGALRSDHFLWSQVCYLPLDIIKDLEQFNVYRYVMPLNTSNSTLDNNTTNNHTDKNATNTDSHSNNTNSQDPGKDNIPNTPSDDNSSEQFNVISNNHTEHNTQ